MWFSRVIITRIVWVDLLSPFHAVPVDTTYRADFFSGYHLLSYEIDWSQGYIDLSVPLPHPLQSIVHSRTLSVLPFMRINTGYKCTLNSVVVSFSYNPRPYFMCDFLWSYVAQQYLQTFASTRHGTSTPYNHCDHPHDRGRLVDGDN